MATSTRPWATVRFQATPAAQTTSLWVETPVLISLWEVARGNRLGRSTWHHELLSAAQKVDKANGPSQRSDSGTEAGHVPVQERQQEHTAIWFDRRRSG